MSQAQASQIWIKCDFHTHSSEDLHDELDHSAMELLHRAHVLGFGALAITLHRQVLVRPELFDAALDLGMLLIPSGELQIEGADVVVLNIDEDEAAGLRSFDDLADLRRRRGGSILVMAPHPFYVFGSSIGARLEKHIECFDSIEYCHFHTAGLNLNESAVALATKYRKPVLATSDAHKLEFFGDHYSLIEVAANPSVEHLFDAIRAGRIKHVSPPWPWRKFASYLLYLGIGHPLQRLFRRLH